MTPTTRRGSPTPEDPPPPPHRRISLLFDLFVLNQHVRTLLAHAMAESPLRPDEYAVYSLIFDVGPMTPTDMARMLGMPPTTISDYVRTMVERGHARRAVNRSDRRSYLVELTNEGLATHRATNAGFERAMRRVTDALTAGEDEVGSGMHALDDAVVAAIADLAADERRRTATGSD